MDTIFRSEEHIPINLDEVTFARALKGSGYETGYAGKWRLDGPRRPGWTHPDRSMGFDDCRFMFNRGHWRKIEDSSMDDVEPTVFPYAVIGDEKTFATDWLTDKTLDFIGKPPEAPFCYMVSYPDPHGPYWVRPPYDTMFRPEDMPLPSTLDDIEVPSWAREAQGDSSFGPGKPDREARLRKALALYCGEVKLIDDSVGRLLDGLERCGILDETVVVFTADHGDYLGEHGLNGKNQLYDTAYRVPMLMRWPGAIPRETVIDNVLSTVDFQPTVPGLMGVHPCGREQGRDGSSLLRGEKAEWRDEAFLHHSSHERAGIFTDRFQLAYVKDDEAILFDRVNDPDQVDNLFGDPEYVSMVSDLTERIVEHNNTVDAPAAQWLKRF